MAAGRQPARGRRYIDLAELGVNTVLNWPRCRQSVALTFIITAAHRKADITQAAQAMEIALAADEGVQRGLRVGVATR